MRHLLPLFLALLTTSTFATDAKLTPLFKSIDLNVGETRTITLTDGSKATVKLLGVEEHRDSVRQALRRADVTVEVNGQRGTIACATYHLPVELGGVRIDCPTVQGYCRVYSNIWAIEHDARLRLWPKTGPFIRPGTFGYPVDQRWAAAGTLFDNEIGDGESRGPEHVYYHQGFDFGGADRITTVHAATNGQVVSARGKSFDDLPECIHPRYDVLYLRDPRGWYYRYSHFDSIDETIQLGDTVTLGQKLGILGKEGASGGWSHLHFELIRPQEGGQYGSDSMYAFLHQVYQAKHDAPVLAVARPMLLVKTGEPVPLDASRSWSKFGKQGLKYEWTFDDGTKATGEKTKHLYTKGGCYCPTLKVTDSQGNVDHDFAKITVADPAVPPSQRCGLHASYWPTQNLRPGDEITFLVRSFGFNPTVGDETWNFDDGTPTTTTRSDGCADSHNKTGYATTKHRFERPGTYLVNVRRQNGNGQWAVDKLEIVIEKPAR